MPGVDSDMRFSSGVERSEGEGERMMSWEQAEDECADYVVVTVPLGVLKVCICLTV
jgi:hypothetical protein